MNTVTELHDADGFRANVGVIKAGHCTLVGARPKVVLFHSRNCGPCAQRKMQLIELAEKYGNIEFYSLKTEGNQPFWSPLGLDGVPTVMCFHRDGRLVKIVGGLLSDVEEAITALTTPSPTRIEHAPHPDHRLFQRHRPGPGPRV